MSGDDTANAAAGSKVRVYEKLQELGRNAQEQVEATKGQRDKRQVNRRNKVLGELTVDLSAVCAVDFEVSQRAWDVFEKKIQETAKHPYPMQLLPMSLHLMAILNCLR